MFTLSRHLSPRRLPTTLIRRSQSSAPPLPRCPSCSQPLTSHIPVCSSCSSISPLPPNITHHQLFGLPDEPNPFVIDVPALRSRFRQAQALCHPDAWATKTSKQQDVAHSLSSRLNEAYQTLLNPLSRAEYLLGQHGLSVSESDQVEDMEFMSDIMDARETIEEPGGEDMVQNLMEKNQAAIAENMKELEELILKKRWKEVKASAIRLRYREGIDRAGRKRSERAEG